MTLFFTSKMALRVTAGFLILALTALAEYPERPIRVIVPTEPGGSIDTVARTSPRNRRKRRLSEKMVVVNQPEQVAQSPPDASRTRPTMAIRSGFGTKAW